MDDSRRDSVMTIIKERAEGGSVGLAILDLLEILEDNEERIRELEEEISSIGNTVKVLRSRGGI